MHAASAADVSKPMKPSILVVAGAARSAQAERLVAAGFDVLQADSATAVLSLMRQKRPAIILLDSPKAEEADEVLDGRIQAIDPDVCILRSVEQDEAGDVKRHWPPVPVVRPQPDRMEALGQLTGGLAHDFNNLLTAIVGTLELLSLRTADPRMQRQIGIAQHAADRAAKLTEQLLAFSRKQLLTLDTIDLNALVVSTRPLLAGILGTEVALSLDLAPAVPPVLGDPAQLELVMLNLALNARDAMPTGGTLTIVTAEYSARDPRLPAEIAERPSVSLALRDNGSGMTEAILAKAFEPFFTTKAPGHGSGLGLSQAYGIARQLGGTIRMTSTVGIGTMVEMFLPRPLPNPGATIVHEPGKG